MEQQPRPKIILRFPAHIVQAVNERFRREEQAAQQQARPKIMLHFSAHTVRAVNERMAREERERQRRAERARRRYLLRRRREWLRAIALHRVGTRRPDRRQNTGGRCLPGYNPHMPNWGQ